VGYPPENPEAEADLRAYDGDLGVDLLVALAFGAGVSELAVPCAHEETAGDSKGAIALTVVGVVGLVLLGVLSSQEPIFGN